MNATQTIPTLEEMFWHPSAPVQTRLHLRYGPLDNPDKAIPARAALALGALQVHNFGEHLYAALK